MRYLCAVYEKLNFLKHSKAYTADIGICRSTAASSPYGRYGAMSLPKRASSRTMLLLMAAYWGYLMRHAAADQFVKNAMFTSEDGIKWYYILYDNDTINGLINTGDIRIKPTDGRQTVDESGSYVFAGHDSRLWNMLEADDEFMQIVSAVDNALYSAGISYLNTIKIFDEDCFAFQPFYKMEKATASAWIGKVVEFIHKGEDKCYAENALNEIFPALNVRAFSYEDYYIDEIDNMEDYARVSIDILAFDEAEKAIFGV